MANQPAIWEKMAFVFHRKLLKAEIFKKLKKSGRISKKSLT